MMILLIRKIVLILPPSRPPWQKNLFLKILNVLGHLKEVRGLTFNSLHGGGMDVFWNDPIWK
jgi:hypothetical protein